jgi:hypothetical protein
MKELAKHFGFLGGSFICLKVLCENGNNISEEGSQVS